MSSYPKLLIARTDYYLIKDEQQLYSISLEFLHKRINEPESYWNLKPLDPPHKPDTYGMDVDNLPYSIRYSASARNQEYEIKLKQVNHNRLLWKKAKQSILDNDGKAAYEFLKTHSDCHDYDGDKETFELEDFLNVTD